MKVINLYGGPGSGKSTTAAGLFYKMKVAGHKVELVTEYAKDLVYGNRLDNMLDQQEYIFAKQNHRLHVLREQVDYAIVDSPILLSTVYVDQEAWPAANKFISFVLAVNNTYDNVNFVLQRPETYQTYGRAHTKEESEQLDARIVEAIQSGSTEGFTTIPVVAPHKNTWVGRLLNRMWPRTVAVEEIYKTLFKIN